MGWDGVGAVALHLLGPGFETHHHIHICLQFQNLGDGDGRIKESKVILDYREGLRPS